MPDMTPGQINAVARALIKQRSVKMTQPIFSSTFTASGTAELSSTQPTVTVIPRNVGLIKGFWVKVLATVTNGSAVQIDRTDFGPANVLSQVQFNDLQNNTRIQTSGWHLNFVNTIKGRMPFGSAIVNSSGIDTPILYGSNWTGQISAPQQIDAGATGTITMWYWVPLAYSEDDLRGCVYANVLNATMQLLLSFPQRSTVDNGSDATLAMYVGDIAGSTTLARISAATITVYQVYMDQLPIANGQVVLPVTDLATIYELKNTALTAIVPNQEFPYQYANFRDFLSTFVVFVNTGAGGIRGVGLDVNYWALQSANFTNIWKKEPGLVALEQSRLAINDDFPPGVYYFGSREKPISTLQYGNMQLILNPITAAAGAYLLVGTEDFALVQALSTAGSLAAS
jgi:hypothetical protein